MPCQELLHPGLYVVGQFDAQVANGVRSQESREFATHPKRLLANQPD